MGGRFQVVPSSSLSNVRSFYCGLGNVKILFFHSLDVGMSAKVRADDSKSFPLFTFHFTNRNTGQTGVKITILV
jgi:hypothetical protein